MRALYEISRGFVNETDESDVLAAAVRLAQDYFGAEAVYLFELQDGRGERSASGQGGSRAVTRLHARWGWELGAGFQPFAFHTGSETAAMRLLVTAGQPAAIPDVRDLPNPQLRELLAARGWRSSIYIPLRAGGEPIGGLGIAYISGYRQFTDHDMELAEALGSSAARALAGVLLHQAERLMRLQLAALQTGNGELERRNRDLSAITQIAQGLAAILDLDSLCLHIVQVLSDTFGYRLVGIALRDKEGARMRTWVAGDTLPAELGYWDSQQGVTGRVIRTRQPALVRDVTIDPDYRAISAAIRSEICVPLLNADQLVGVLNVESDAPDSLDDNDLRLLTTLAPQITIAVENARLFAAARRQATQLGLVNRIAHEISGLATADLRTLLHNSAALLQRELGYSNVSIMLLDPVAEELVCHASVGEYAAIIYRDYRQPVALGMIGWVARNGTPLVANDVSEEPAFIQVSPEETPAAEAVMPLIYAGEVLGVLDAESNHPDVFGPADVQMLETLADQLAFAIAYARYARP
jgi:GAF domain-containing protein